MMMISILYNKLLSYISIMSNEQDFLIFLSFSFMSNGRDLPIFLLSIMPNEPAFPIFLFLLCLMNQIFQSVPLFLLCLINQHFHPFYLFHAWVPSFQSSQSVSRWVSEWVGGSLASYRIIPNGHILIYFTPVAPELTICLSMSFNAHTRAYSELQSDQGAHTGVPKMM